MVGSFYFVHILKHQIQCISTSVTSQDETCMFLPPAFRQNTHGIQMTSIKKRRSPDDELLYLPVSYPWIFMVASFSLPWTCICSPSYLGQEGKNLHSPGACTTKWLRWYSLWTTAIGFLPVLKVGSPRSTCPWSGSGEGPLLRCCHLLHILFHRQKARQIALWTIIYRDTNHIHQVSNFTT